MTTWDEIRKYIEFNKEDLGEEDWKRIRQDIGSLSQEEKKKMEKYYRTRDNSRYEDEARAKYFEERRVNDGK